MLCPLFQYFSKKRVFREVVQKVFMFDFDPALEFFCSGLPESDAQHLREERAAILEHCAGFSRAEAEKRAGISHIPA